MSTDRTDDKRKYIKQINSLIGCRLTKMEIIEKLKEFSHNRTSDPILEPFSELMEGSDLGFNTNIGSYENSLGHEIYLDFEIYLLPTREIRKNLPENEDPVVYYITEINDF